MISFCKKKIYVYVKEKICFSIDDGLVCKIAS